MWETHFIEESEYLVRMGRLQALSEATRETKQLMLERTGMFLFPPFVELNRNILDVTDFYPQLAPYTHGHL